MKPLGWRRGANDYLYGKVEIDGERVYAEWLERIVTKRRGRLFDRRVTKRRGRLFDRRVTKRRGRLFDRRVIEEQTGAARPARMR